jgi:tetratricopeptide (TPR) repeat protein
MMNLAYLYQGQGRYDEAEPLVLETLDTQKRVLGDDHPQTAITLYNLACMEAVRGDRPKALEWLRQSVDAGWAQANWAQADWMTQDSDLEPLHGPEFDALVERARENAAKQQAKP